MRINFSSILLAAVLVASTTASAAAQAPNTWTAPQEQQQAAPPAEAPAEAPPVDDSARLRFGGAFDFNVLAATTGTAGLGVGLTLRIGVQFNQILGLYYQPHGILGGWLDIEGEGTVAALFNAAMVEFTLPFIHLGFGPSYDVASLQLCNTTLTRCIGADGSAFGLDSRIALVIGGVGRGRRGGFSINLNVHSSFFGDGEALINVAVGFGGEMY